MRNSALNLFNFAVSRGYKVAIQCAEEGDVLQKSTDDWSKALEAIDATGYAIMNIRDVKKKETIGWALVITHDNPEEWVSDYGVNDFMDEWNSQFYSH